ncbi:MAG TPA: thermonuclease family protein [Pararhizobium sp.]|uniref:thermonuclease family protein n=1 Tax=Pararhizobium sp. TaxID=1977563 RepID=UPI002CE87E64|nr:thermonuclease family protein [Pararhizobium sp.]HTO33268.1 thermonuclease family protein [Pararhizobium sp.]
MKKHLLTAGGGLLCIALTIFILMSGASAIQGQQAATPDFSLETPDMSDMPDLGGDDMDKDIPVPGAGAGRVEGGEPLAEPPIPDPSSSDALPSDPLPSGERSMIAPDDTVVRGIAPEQFGLPEDGTTQPLERIEPRLPLSDPVAKSQPVPVVLRHPVALSAGLIRFGDRQLQLEGLAPQDADRTCGDGAATWPCGIVARTAFRNFLRARALRCTVPKNGWQGTVTAACTVSDLDPAAWLAENGWAETPAGSPLASKVDAARKSRLGFFGDDPRDFSATPEALDGVDLLHN